MKLQFGVINRRKTAGFALASACAALLGCQSGTSPAIAAQQNTRPATAAKPAAQAPRPHWVIGRARYADGRPIANFEVQVNWPAGILRAPGTGGHYAIQTDPSVTFFLSSVTAIASIPYQGKTYLLRLCPVDRVADGVYHPDVTKGVVRDFVLNLSGPVPHGLSADLDPLDSKRQDILMTGGFYGFEVQIGSDVVFTKSILNPALGVVTGHGETTGVFQDHSTYAVTLTPIGPLADGSTGQVIVRTVKDVAAMFGTFRIHDIPLGVYTVTVRAAGPDGAARGLKLREFANSALAFTGELNTLDSVTVTVPPAQPPFGFVAPVVIVQMPLA